MVHLVDHSFVIHTVHVHTLDFKGSMNWYTSQQGWLGYLLACCSQFIVEPASRFSKSDFPPVRFCDWLQAVQQASYEHVKEICVWGVTVTDMDATELSLCMESQTGQQNLKFLTLLDVGLSDYGLHRITR